ncbi:hypothetical protein E3P86_03859 [Wallemia ichthyophaga]|uniref:PPPDE domain-containing protein n=1 Tax=Wallemia ichthyophaga TaxID=245174 RepID=A0A4T0IFK6_WALIC|nr:hypothetical protein E3P86_03859 [Wallemia ichthyophaga]
MGNKVEIAIYDWSNEAIRYLSSNGRSHTTVVVFNREFEFSYEGIRSLAPPGSSYKGTPSRVINTGITEIDEDTYKDFLDGLCSEFNAGSYNVAYRNGNTFTAKAIDFLCGAKFPEFINAGSVGSFGGIGGKGMVGTQAALGGGVGNDHARNNIRMNLSMIPNSQYHSADVLPQWPTLNVISKEMMQNIIMSNYKAILMTVSPLTTYSSNSVELSQAFYHLAAQRGIPGMNNGFMRLDVMMNKEIGGILGVNEYQPTMFIVFKGGMRVNVWQDNDVNRTMNALTEFLNSI